MVIVVGPLVALVIAIALVSIRIVLMTTVSQRFTLRGII